MSTEQRRPRRTRVSGERNANIYSRENAAGKTVYEVGYKIDGRQKFETVRGGITAARARRDEILGQRARGERVASNRRLRFGDAADSWLSDQVASLRPATREIYRNAIDNHLRPRWGHRRLEQITVADVARLIRELRAEGKSEHTIAGVVKAGNRVFKFADRWLHWHGSNPVERLEKSERPKPSLSQRRRLFEGDELAQTLQASRDPWLTLFAFAGTTGARLSECLGMTWRDVDLADLDEASVTLGYQVDRQGQRQPMKTDESRRTVELPRSLSLMLAELKAKSSHSQPDDFVFATRTGRPIQQRNVTRELRRAMKAARRPDGKPTYPVLHEVDARGKTKPVPAGSVPSFHGFRHTAASEAIRDGESVEEVSWQLGHRNSNVTRAVYVQEIKDSERRARRRASMEARYGSVLAAAQEATANEPKKGEKVVDLDSRR